MAHGSKYLRTHPLCCSLQYTTDQRLIYLPTEFQSQSLIRECCSVRSAQSAVDRGHCFREQFNRCSTDEKEKKKERKNNSKNITDNNRDKKDIEEQRRICPRITRA